MLLLLPAPPDGVVPPFARASGQAQGEASSGGGRGASPLAVGVHAPNRAWREVDFSRVALGGFQTVKMMSYHPVEAYARLQRHHPRIEFAVRLNTPWNELPPPEAFAAAHVGYLDALVKAGYEPWVEIGNEPNLELHPQAEDAFAAWYQETLRYLRAAVPRAKYGFPGLAQDWRETAWWETNAAAVEASDWLGVHAYWIDEREMLDPRRGLRLIDVHRRFPRLPMLVTEAGNHGPGVTAAQRAREYPRFVRTLARLPYVRAVHFFILAGTPEWQSFFFDDAMTLAVREAAREPVPVLDGLAGTRRYVLAALQPFVAGTGRRPKQPVRPDLAAKALEPAPTPLPFSRRRLLADPAPRAPDVLIPSGSLAGARWVALMPGTPPAAQLRTASGYLATHLSARLELAPPGPDAPLALQLAEADLFAGGMGTANGFALLWDGELWRLQYRQAGQVAAEATLVGVGAADRQLTEAPAERAGSLDGWYRVELALEPRSAAAWVWRRHERQPDEPNAVFAPPEAAALDAARPRALFLPAHPVANLVLEGATRFS